MAAKKNSKMQNGSTSVLRRESSPNDVIRRILSKSPEIDAVFLVTDESHVVHVFSVVREFHANLYDKLLKRERTIEDELTNIAFEFHVRAHQGREPALAVPFEAQL